jgi:hypothetical protein
LDEGRAKISVLDIAPEAEFEAEFNAVEFLAEFCFVEFAAVEFAKEFTAAEFAVESPVEFTLAFALKFCAALEFVLAAEF